MRITDLDPLRHGLIFERFLNPERMSMPDFDVDFDERRRGEVIRYVTEKYGADRVAQIITYGTIKAKAAVKDSSRVLGFPYALGDRITKAFPPAAHSLPTRLVLPSLNVDSPVVEVGWKTSVQNGQLVSEWEVADYAVGFLKTTALPGAPGNTVMAGHNNINGEVFKNLIDLKVGDDVFVYVDQTAYRFVVTQKLLLKEYGVPMEQRLQNAQWIAPTNDTRLTLVSCWPYTSNTYRVIIVATPNG